MKKADGDKIIRKVEKKEDEGKKRDFFKKIGTIGIIGWSITLPMLGGIALGAWIDTAFKGKYSWTIMLMIGGLIGGCCIAWEWIKKMTGGRDGEN